MEFPRTKLSDAIILPSTGEHEIPAHEFKRLEKKNDSEQSLRNDEDLLSYEENLRHWGIELR